MPNQYKQNTYFRPKKRESPSNELWPMSYLSKRNEHSNNNIIDVIDNENGAKIYLKYRNCFENI